MNEPRWVLDRVVLAVHRRQIAEHGGLDGVRDHGLLESALLKAQHRYYYATPKATLAEVAAAYAYGIACNHAFLDGNKRTALVVFQLFLRLNHGTLTASEGEKYHAMMALASGQLSEAAFADWIARHLVTGQQAS